MEGTTQNSALKKPGVSEIFGALFLVLGVLVFFSVFSFYRNSTNPELQGQGNLIGAFGHYSATVILYLFGNAAFFLGPYLFLIGALGIYRGAMEDPLPRVLSLAMILFSLSVLLFLSTGDQEQLYWKGGIIGRTMGMMLEYLFGWFGTLILSLGGLFGGLFFSLRLPLPSLIGRFFGILRKTAIALVVLSVVWSVLRLLRAAYDRTRGKLGRSGDGKEAKDIGENGSIISAAEANPGALNQAALQQEPIHLPSSESDLKPPDAGTGHGVEANANLSTEANKEKQVKKSPFWNREKAERKPWFEKREISEPKGSLPSEMVPLEKADTATPPGADSRSSAGVCQAADSSRSSHPAIENVRRLQSMLDDFSQRYPVGAGKGEGEVRRERDSSCSFEFAGVYRPDRERNAGSRQDAFFNGFFNQDESRFHFRKVSGREGSVSGSFRGATTTEFPSQFGFSGTSRPGREGNGPLLGDIDTTLLSPRERSSRSRYGISERRDPGARVSPGDSRQRTVVREESRTEIYDDRAEDSEEDTDLFLSASEQGTVESGGEPGEVAEEPVGHGAAIAYELEEAGIVSEIEEFPAGMRGAIQEEEEFAEEMDEAFGDEDGMGASDRESFPANPARREPESEVPLIVLKSRRYRLPMEILTLPERHHDEEFSREMELTQERLERVMHDYGIQAQVTRTQRGPIITLYEIKPEPGVRVNRILGIYDEIKMNLEAASLRIIAPIPGKSTIGIEIPNKNRDAVLLGEIARMDGGFFSKSRDLSIILGKDIAGNNIYVDLAKLPHLLIAGATGAGKSVYMNAIIVSLLYAYSPEDVRFIMVDPKMVELKLYEGIPHLLMPVITDVKMASRALTWAIQEMERRYQILSRARCRDIRSYNERILDGRIPLERYSSDAGPEKARKMPYIIILIDELSDLMMVSAKDVEDSIIRLTQKARAVGIHVIMATQRPSVDVITALIKANCPARISFQVAQKTDSRTILDCNGAETLLGRGDMLYKSPTSTVPVRIQAPLVTEAEIEKIVQESRKYGDPVYVNLPGESEEGFQQGDSGELDEELFENGWRIVQETGKTSTSYIQRRLRIGYNRAANLIELMEERGYLGPAIGNKPREILKRS